MSNYCFQQVTAVGDTKEIERFITFVQAEGNGSTSVFDVKALAGKLGVEAPASSWALEVINDIEPGKIVYELETEWEEDQSLIPALAKEFPTLKILHEYAEPNMGFGGFTEFVNGEPSLAGDTDDVEVLRYRTEPWVTEFLQFWFLEGE